MTCKTQDIEADQRLKKISSSIQACIPEKTDSDMKELKSRFHVGKFLTQPRARQLITTTTTNMLFEVTSLVDLATPAVTGGNSKYSLMLHIT